jgi:hypothetical protein
VTFSDRACGVGYYSLLRFLPDPNRDEPVNVGLFLVDEGGTWARFRIRVPKTRLDAMGRREDVGAIEHWAETIQEAYETDGDIGFSRSGRLSVDTLADWAREFGGLLRVTPPRVALNPSLEELWHELFTRYVGRSRRLGANEVRALSVAPPVTGAHETRQLVEGLLETIGHWRAFDATRVVRDQPFPGLRSSHVADVAIMNGAVTAVAQAIPLVHGSESEIIQTRALLVDAAIDLPTEVTKLAIYDDPPAERVELLEGTRAVLAEIGRNRTVELVPRRTFDALGVRFEGRFFPDLH